MKRLIIYVTVAVLAFGAVTTCGPAQSPDRERQVARELVNLVFDDETFSQFRALTVGTMFQQFRTTLEGRGITLGDAEFLEAQQDMLRAFDRTYLKEEWLEGFADLYADEFSVAEMADFVQLFREPLGNQWLKSASNSQQFSAAELTNFLQLVPEPLGKRWLEGQANLNRVAAAFGEAMIQRHRSEFESALTEEFESTLTEEMDSSDRTDDTGTENQPAISNSQSTLELAEQGDAEAQYTLAGIYANGRGVPQDDVQAYMWLNISASKFTGSEREQAVEARDGIASGLPDAQRAEAQRLAREWNEAHPQ